MQNEVTLTIRLDADLKERFERQCDRTMNSEIVSMIRQFTESREALIKLSVKPDVKAAITAKAQARGLTPELWVAMLIKSALKG